MENLDKEKLDYLSLSNPFKCSGYFSEALNKKCNLSEKQISDSIHNLFKLINLDNVIIAIATIIPCTFPLSGKNNGYVFIHSNGEINAILVPDEYRLFAIGIFNDLIASNKFNILSSGCIEYNMINDLGNYDSTVILYNKSHIINNLLVDICYLNKFGTANMNPKCFGKLHNFIYGNFSNISNNYTKIKYSNVNNEAAEDTDILSLTSYYYTLKYSHRFPDSYGKPNMQFSQLESEFSYPIISDIIKNTVINNESDEYLLYSLEEYLKTLEAK